MSKYLHTKHFTLEEARKELTAVHAVASRMVELKRSLDILGWDIYRHRYFGGRGPNGDGTFPREMETLVEIVKSLDDRGIVVKGLDEGLIDFPHIRENGEEIYLCWKIGEDDILYWHRIQMAMREEKASINCRLRISGNAVESPRIRKLTTKTPRHEVGINHKWPEWSYLKLFRAFVTCLPASCVVMRQAGWFSFLRCFHPIYGSLSVLARSRVVCLVLLFASALCVQPVRAQTDSEPPRWSAKTLVEFHQQLHPNLKAQDVYKLFYQSAFGVEHILADSAGVTAYLVNELSSIDTTIRGELVLEQISLNGELVRVNLRPFKALNLDPLLLVKVMFQSARETIPDTILFYRLWNEFSALVRFGLLKFSSDDLKVWLARLNGSSEVGGDAAVEGGTIVPVHHSSDYSIVNRPAYRVVRRGVFEAAFGKISQ